MMTQHELELIHQTTLRILEEIGLRLEHDVIVERLLEAGARPGLAANEVRFPREMVQEYLALAPQTVELAARNGTTTVLTPDGPTVYWTTPGMYVLEGSSRREAVTTDLATVARLCDHLEHVQGIIGMAMTDVPPPCRDFVGLRIIAESCRKHARVLCFSSTGAEALTAMRQVFPGPWFSAGFTAHGPLRWTHLALDIFRNTAGHGIPLTINGEPMAGVSGPVTLAGSIAVGNAEILAGIIINQLLEPGRPVIYNLGLAHIFDMRAATAVTGGPENALFARASVELARFYQLPSSSWVSTEAVYEDEQAALEKMFGFTTHAQAGVNVIWGMGQLESEMTISLGQLLIDNEMIGYANRYARGFTVNDETLCYDLIREVGIAGNYLDTEHTLEHYAGEFFQPSILNRHPREQCPQSLSERAYEQAMSLLAADCEEKITQDERNELLRIEHAYRKLMA